MSLLTLPASLIIISCMDRQDRDMRSAWKFAKNQRPSRPQVMNFLNLIEMDQIMPAVRLGEMMTWSTKVVQLFSKMRAIWFQNIFWNQRNISYELFQIDSCERSGGFMATNLATNISFRSSKGQNLSTARIWEHDFECHHPAQFSKTHPLIREYQSESTVTPFSCTDSCVRVTEKLSQNSRGLHLPAALNSDVDIEC